MLTDTDWEIRLFIYRTLSASGRAPDVDAVSDRFGIPTSVARESLKRLHDAHALVLRADGSDVLMANPFSAAPTDYRVFCGGAELYANCAWDSLGIPAMLGADARIEARHSLDGGIMKYKVEARQLIGGGECLVHFAQPFRKWYDDIVDT